MFFIFDIYISIKAIGYADKATDVHQFNPTCNFYNFST